MEILSSCGENFVDADGLRSAIMNEMEAAEVARIMEMEGDLSQLI